MPKTPEEIAAEAAAGVKDPPVEEPKVETDAVIPDPVETAARSKGWKPKEEYAGEPGMWVDAKEFLGREPLYAALRESKRIAKNLERTVSTMARQFTKRVEHDVNAKIAELEFQKEKAIESGSVAEVRAIDKAIAAENATKAEAPTAKQVAPEVEAWVDENPWFIKDTEMHDFAIAHNDVYLKRHPGDLEGCLKSTAAAVKKAFPEKFKARATGPPAAPAAPVEGGGAPANNGRKYSVSRLTADQRMAHDQYIKAKTFDALAKEAKMTPSEYYVKSLDEIGELTR